MGRDLNSLLPPKLLLDGGIGTALLAKGVEAESTPTEAWNTQKPSAVFEVHRQFFEAGAMAAQTNTFGANRPRLRTFAADRLVRELNIAGVEVARQAAPSGALIIGCMGPTGLIPPPEGNANLIEIEDAFAEQAAYLAEAGVDFLHVETMYHPKECRAALRGCRSGAPDLPVAVSIAFKMAQGSYMTPMGFAPELMLQVLTEEDADGFGVNCSLAPMDLVHLVRLLVNEAAGKPVFAQPTIAPTGSAPLYPMEFASGVETLFAIGARAVGGGCGTGPADISAAYEVTGGTRLPSAGLSSAGLPSAATL